MSNKSRLIFLVFTIFFISLSAQADFLVQQVRLGSKIKVLNTKLSNKKFTGTKKVLKSIPYFLSEVKLSESELMQSLNLTDQTLANDLQKNILYEEVLYTEGSLPKVAEAIFQEQVLQSLSLNNTWPGSEVRTLVDQGPVENRIDLTIVGDGYTAQEKQRFFVDAQRITDDLFAVNTFNSYLPLFNVHAVFIPSNESGLTDIDKVDTALGLYRSPKGSKRGVMLRNHLAANRAVSLAPDSDYPILLANDDFYGGLGGRFAITTRSHNSGSMVLRHELGHNFGDVGEEYDGGYVYSGANSSMTSDVKWKHWIDTPQTEVYRAKFLSGDYVWQDLRSKYERNFNFPQGDYDFVVKISSVGWANEGEVDVVINGQSLLLDGVYTQDRSFFYLARPEALSPGRHKIEIEKKVNVRNRDHVLAFAQLLAEPKSINRTEHFVGAYNTFNSAGQQSGYRPTYESCLMRNMRSMDFCAVDKENMWHKFLARLNLIDEIKVVQRAGHRDIEVLTPALDGLKFTYYKKQNGQYKKLNWSGAKNSVHEADYGEYRVEVEFQTPEVRKYNTDFQQVVDFRVN